MSIAALRYRCNGDVIPTDRQGASDSYHKGIA